MDRVGVGLRHTRREPFGRRSRAERHRDVPASMSGPIRAHAARPSATKQSANRLVCRPDPGDGSYGVPARSVTYAVVWSGRTAWERRTPRSLGRARAVRHCQGHLAGQPAGFDRLGDPREQPDPASLRPGVLVGREQVSPRVVPAGEDTAVVAVGSVAQPPGEDVVHQVRGGIRDVAWAATLPSDGPSAGSAVTREGVDQRVAAGVTPRPHQSDHDEDHERADDRCRHGEGLAQVARPGR